LHRKDVIGEAATGSGKTLAFGAAMLEHVKKGEGLQALILAPTRELAEQSAQALRKFGKYYHLTIKEIYGGVAIGPQIEALETAEIIVGTPGRILDHAERETINFSKIKILVLDEADRMLDMGFLPDVERIIAHCPTQRQTLLFSATISHDIQHLAHKFMQHPVTVSAESYVDPSKLKQTYYDVPSHLKFSLLVHLLKQEKPGLIMVFCNTRMNADMVARNLMRFEIDSIAIHGGLSQSKRNWILQKFHAEKAKILVCTDVAARGLDIKNVSHVYNYDVPKTSTEYIHRIGRTARAGKEGIAITIISSRDYENFSRVREDESLHITQEKLPYLESLQVNFQRRPQQRMHRGSHRISQTRFGERQRTGHEGGHRSESHRESHRPYHLRNSQSHGRKPFSHRERRF
jgi:ATP-dependent RNA helicase DeaD